MPTGETEPILETWQDVKIHGLSLCIDNAFIEPDLWMRAFFLKNLMLAKWMRAAILDGSRMPYD
jgi:hypothetical protein